MLNRVPSQAGFQTRTCSLCLSHPAFWPGKKPTLWLAFILFLWTSSRFSICHSSRHFRPQNLFATFSDHPLLDPWFCTSSFKNTNTLSHSQADHGWMRHGCTTASTLPNPPGWWWGCCSACSWTLPGVGSGKGLSWIKAFTSGEPKQIKM